MVAATLFIIARAVSRVQIFGEQPLPDFAECIVNFDVHIRVQVLYQIRTEFFELDFVGRDLETVPGP